MWRPSLRRFTTNRTQLRELTRPAQGPLGTIIPIVILMRTALRYAASSAVLAGGLISWALYPIAQPTAQWNSIPSSKRPEFALDDTVPFDTAALSVGKEMIIRLKCAGLDDGQRARVWGTSGAKS